ncbi:MAG: resolvase [Cyanobacteria bacterium P01_E01_bin.34]
MPGSSRDLELTSRAEIQHYLLGFDPGRDKCGLAIASIPCSLKQQLPASKVSTGVEICHREIVRSDKVETRIAEQFDTFHLQPDTPLDFVMGNQTTARRWQQRLLQAFPNLNIHLVDERFSSQEARQRYWSIYPARGLQRLVPLGMREPPRPIDDIVAQILIERYLEQEGFH